MSVLIAGTHANCELALSAAYERRDGGGQSVGGRKRKKGRERELSWGEWKSMEMSCKKKLKKRKREN